jgi:hypothetical protein
VDAALAACFPLEVLDRVGDVQLPTIEARVVDGVVEQTAGGSDERRSRPILFVAGLLADQRDPGVGRAFAEHGLRAALPEVARAAALSLGGQRSEELLGGRSTVRGPASLTRRCRVTAQEAARAHCSRSTVGGPRVARLVGVLALGFVLEAVSGGLEVATLVGDELVGELLITGDVLTEPVVDGAVLTWFLDCVGHGRTPLDAVHEPVPGGHFFQPIETRLSLDGLGRRGR